MQDYANLRAVAGARQRSLGWLVRHALRKFLEASGDVQLDLRFEANPQLEKHEGVHRGLATLATTDWQRIRRGSSKNLHGLHPYPTRFTPEVPASLIQALSRPGETVLDPFCGSGTTLLEAVRLRRHAVGVDISPLAVLIAKVKCTRFNRRDEQAIKGSLAWATSIVAGFYGETHRKPKGKSQLSLGLRDHCSKIGLDAAPIARAWATSELTNWFGQEAFCEISLIRAVLEQCPLPAARDLLKVALSSILVSVSFQSSEIRRNRVRRNVEPYETLRRWKKKVEDILDLSAAFSPPIRWRAAEIYQGDARDLNFLDSALIDLIVTSAPYPNIYDYRLFQKLRLLWLGLAEVSELNRGPDRDGSILTDQEGALNYNREIHVLLRSFKRVLKPAGLCALIGPSRSQHDGLDHEDRIGRASESSGFRVIATFGKGMSSTTSTLRNNRASLGAGESIVVLQAMGEEIPMFQPDHGSIG